MAQNLLPFTGHLEEFRRRLLVSLAAVLACTLFCFAFAEEILGILTGPIRDQIGQIYFFSPADAFVIKVKAALLAGLIIASPMVCCQIWLFISPALRPQERKALVPLVFIMSFLFLAGALFCFFLVLPAALDFLIGQQTAFMKPVLSMNEYMGFLSGMVIAFGFAFNLPLAVVTLAACGLVTVRTLNRCQRHVIVMIFIAAAILTPSPDIASQLLLAVPLLVLFEISVAAAGIIEMVKKGSKRA